MIVKKNINKAAQKYFMIQPPVGSYFFELDETIIGIQAILPLARAARSCSQLSKVDELA